MLQLLLDHITVGYYYVRS